MTTSRAAFGRVLPKNKIYEHATPSTKLKERFVQQVEQITWQQKLAPETINLPATRAVPEIQIFRITLKTGELDTSVLQCIDHAIPFPLYFELQYGDRIKATAAFKRPSDGDQSKWVVSSYFDGPWLPATTPRVPLPLVLDLEQLYARLLTALSPFPPRPGEPMTAFVVRMDEIRRRERELAQAEARLRKEKQFNRKVAINAEVRALKQALATLTAR
ncbi:MAG: DUF4391 domain-containing protein [Caldilineaceae bacterium]